MNAKKAFWLVDLAVYFHRDCLSFNPRFISSSSVKLGNLFFLKKEGVEGGLAAG